ncbi:MAG: Wzz/FepE/Etk N-terminal domain-containing protein [Chloroflexota bacterium]
MDVQQYVQALRNGWWILLALLLISLGVGIAYSYSQTPVYEATTTFVANPTFRIADTRDVIDSIDTLAARSGVVATYCQVLKSGAVFDNAAASLGLFPADLADPYHVNCVVLPDSSVLQVDVQGPSAQLTADLANAIGHSGLAYVGDLQEVYELRLLDEATISSDPISPNHSLDIILSGILGLMIGFILIFIRAVLGPSSRGMALRLGHQA